VKDMEPFSPELQSILVLVALICGGLSLIAVSIVIIYLLCDCYRGRRHRSPTVIPSNTRPSIVSGHSTDSISSTTLENPITVNNKHKRRQQQHRSDSISVIEDHHHKSSSSFYNQNKHQQQQQQQQQQRIQQEYKRDESNETTTSESGHDRRRRHRQQQRQYQSAKPITGTHVAQIDRHTPYPPDVIERERYMNQIKFPSTNKH